MNTIKDYKEPLLKECNRVLEFMSREHPSSDNYKAMVEAFLHLDKVVSGIEYDEWDRELRYDNAENKRSQAELYIEAAQERFGKTKEEVSLPDPDVSSVPEPVGEPERATVVEEPQEEKLTKEKVRALLKEASEAGVLIQPILEKYVPEGKKCNLSSVKVSDYPALVKELKDAK